MIDDVKNLIDEGWALHLLKPKSKMPLLSKWSTRPKATFRELKNTYRQGMNLGVRLGRVSKLPSGEYLAVIDCDVKSTDAKHRAEMLGKLDGLGVPRSTRCVVSGRGNGSMHIYIATKTPVAARRLAQSPEKVKTYIPSVAPSKSDRDALSVEELESGFRMRPAWEISLMGEGQQVVIPPSVHPDSGSPYRWHNKKASVVSFDLWHDPAAAAPTEEKTASKKFEPVPVDILTLDISDKTLHAIDSGEGVSDRSAALFGAAIDLKKAGLDENQILSVLTDTKYFLGSVAFEHANTTSRARAADWVRRFTLKKAAKAATGLLDFEVISGDVKVDEGEGTPDLALELVDPGDWRNSLDRDGKGKVKNTFVNLKRIFEGVADGKKLLSFDEFSHRIQWTDDSEFGNWAGEAITDAHCISVKMYFSRHFKLEVSTFVVHELLQEIARGNSFHPVKDFVMSLKWDKKPRLKRWLQTYLGASGNADYLAEVGTKFIVAMIARMFEPGVKFDYVLILEGDQGVGKSSTAKILASPWFSDSHITVTDKDAVLNIQNAWICELGELSALRKSEVNSVKEFISRQVDKIRPPYGRMVVEYPRRNVFIGTTNNDNYLNDPTGNRRFWPVKIGKLKRQLLVRDRDQLIAEAYERWLLGEKLYLSPEGEKLAAFEQEARRMVSELEVIVTEFFQSDEGKELAKKGFKTFDLLDEVPDLLHYRADRSFETRCGPVLRKLGLENKAQRDKNSGNRTRRWRWISLSEGG